jgi:hypothetical protein
MQECTLKVNMILGDGKYYNRGTVLDIDILPAHLRTRDYIAKGAVSINKVMPIDVIEIEDVKMEDEEGIEQQPSPMRELTFSDLRPVEEQEELSKKKIVRKVIRRK